MKNSHNMNRINAAQKPSKEPIVTELEVVDDMPQEAEFTPVCEMAKVADFRGYKLWVWTNDEGQIPHFHIIKGKPTAPTFDACVQFKVAEYYPHGGKHTDKLPRNHLKDFVSLLKSQDPYALGTQSIWQTLIIEWNRNDNKVQVPATTPMPDFMHIVYPTTPAE